MSGIVLGWVLAHTIWQTAFLALAYAAWRGFSPRASVSLRHHLALAALGLALAAAGVSWWSLSGTTPTSPPVRSHGSASSAPAAAPVPVAATHPAPVIAGPPPGQLRAAMSALAVLWIAGVLVLAVRLGGGLLLAGRIRRRAATARRPDLEEAHRALALRLGLGRPVPLLESSEIDSPVTLGWLRPVVLFPVDLLRRGSPDLLTPLLAHELAHVRAGDYAINLAQTGLDALFFLCPGARWLSAQVRVWREYRCDDRASALGDGRSYARALASLMETRRPAAALVAPGAAGPRLVDRIRRLLEGDPMPRSRAGWTLTTATAMAVTALAGAALFSVSRVHAAQAGAPTAAGSPASASGAAWDGSCLSSLDPAFPGNALVPPPGGRALDCTVRIDGRPLARNTFSSGSRGMLTLVHGNPPWHLETPIAFTVALHRKGQVLSEPGMAFVGRVFYQVDLAEVLVHARPGDQLILDPVDERDGPAKRILTLEGC